MPAGYGSQRDYMESVSVEAAARQTAVEAALREVFSPFIEKREVDVVLLTAMTAVELSALEAHAR
ncbi:MAG: hypothetical protein HYY30_12475 [Chloroflexi bacterium]|nr:hypothetical protein [Chloroflexota bacterium]